MSEFLKNWQKDFSKNLASLAKAMDPKNKSLLAIGKEIELSMTEDLSKIYYRYLLSAKLHSTL